MAERLARALHEGRVKSLAASVPFMPDAAMATSFGLHPESFGRLLNDLGFRKQEDGWSWRSRDRKRRRQARAAASGNAFGALAHLRKHHG